MIMQVHRDRVQHPMHSDATVGNVVAIVAAVVEVEVRM